MRTRTTVFAWDMLRSNGKLLAYPCIRIAAGFLLLASMWSLIFDNSAVELAHELESIGTSLSSSSGTGDDPAAAHKTTTLAEHIHWGTLLLFLVLNALVGVFSVGALTSQAVAIARGEKRGLVYGYGRALIRLPQLLAWWLVTIVVGLILSVIESYRTLGLIVAMLLGAVWSILSFFSVTAIMINGCGPFAAIGQSKTAIVDSFKKLGQPMSAGDLKTVRRGLRVGGPLLILNLILSLLTLGLLFVDIRFGEHGRHSMHANAFFTLLLVMVLNGSFRAALDAIFKAIVWVWAEEGTVPESVDAKQLEGVFVTTHARTV